MADSQTESPQKSTYLADTRDEEAIANRFPIASGKETFALLWELIKPERTRLFWAVIVLTAGAQCGVLVPKLMGTIVDEATAGATMRDLLLGVGVKMLLAVIGSAILGAQGFAMTARVAETMIARLREDMVTTVLRLPVARIEKAGSGDIVSRASDDVAQVSTAVTQVMPVATNAFFTLAVSIFGVGTVHPAFILAFCLVLPVQFYAFRSYIKMATPVYAAERGAMAERANELLSSVNGSAAVRAFALRAVRQQIIAHWSWVSVRHFVDARITHNIIMGWMHLAEFLGMAATLVLGFYLVQADATSIGGAMAAMLLFMRLFGPLTRVVFVLDIAQTGFTSLTRIVGVLRQRPAEHGEAESTGATGVQVEKLRFSYADVDAADSDADATDIPLALKDISLNIPDGQTYALVGTSGAGKSTLAAIIAGLRTPLSGSVMVAGYDMVNDAEEARGRAVVLVTQEVHVFEGPLRDDLRLVAPNATDEEICAALREVGADWALEFSDGLDTIVGRGGLLLDPVRAQQLALARVILANPPVVILDEATAEAGTSGAEVLADAAVAVTENRTALVVAHRLDQAEAADGIVVMEHGEIIEQGSHEELAAAGGRYAELWAAWCRGRGE